VGSFRQTTVSLAFAPLGPSTLAEFFQSCPAWSTGVLSTVSILVAAT
jgi:hypothetical protein